MGFGSAGVDSNGQARLTATYNFPSSGTWGLKITNSSSVTVDSTTLYVTTDLVSPTIPGTPSSTSRTSSSISLTWTASTDNVAVTAYQVLCNGTVVATVSTNSATVTGLASSTSYSFQVIARDAAGNSSTPSGTAYFSTTAATTWVYINGWTLPGNAVVGQGYSIAWQGSSNGYGYVVLFYKAPGSSTWSGTGSGGANNGTISATGGFYANVPGVWQFGVGYGGALPSYTSASITVN
jgi:chitodextrinase